jgi:hypothetical protein
MLRVLEFTLNRPGEGQMTPTRVPAGELFASFLTFLSTENRHKKR